MLAQNFKPAADLQITEIERDALVRVLGMLERDELSYRPMCSPERFHGDYFNMDGFLAETKECGTIGCIAGWASVVARPHRAFFWDDNLREELSDAAYELFFARGRGSLSRNEIKPWQAAMALRNYLTFGEPRWDDVLAV